MRKRVWITAGLLVVCAVTLHGISHGERVPLHKFLESFPSTLGSWRGHDLLMDKDIVQAAGVTDYVNRVYINNKGDFLNFYVGYYASQRTGDTIHSPKHCLPGGGWTPLSSSRLTIQLNSGRTVTVNDYTIGKGLQRQVVLYWYQSQGRVVASEYWARCWLIVDAVTHDRTDGALVRVIAPATNGVAPARTLAVAFVKEAFPHLRSFLPD